MPATHRQPPGDPELRILVTGGAGFIGSNLVRFLLRQPGTSILNVDKLVFPGCSGTIREFESSPRSKYAFSRTDLCDYAGLKRIFNDFRPEAVMHLAAESHVDRSIDEPESFIQSNIIGTYHLLKIALDYWKRLAGAEKNRFRFHHVSTDEVYGALGPEDPPFTETSPYAPNSPYSASKASADHLVRAWHHTYGLPVVISNCSNNYGPYQFPEKLIPLVITRALRGESLPVYGDGLNVRDWLYVEDHVCALFLVLKNGRTGENYNVGGNCEKTNNEVVHMICDLLDELLPDSGYRPHSRLITHVEDRPGHDRRYAMNTGKIRAELGWSPEHDFPAGLRKTVTWYLQNPGWCDAVTSGTYRGERLGLG